MENQPPSKPGKKHKILFFITGGAILMIVVFFDLYIFGLLGGNKVKVSQEQAAAYKFQILKTSVGDGSNYFMGTTTPRVVIVEFADFACPYCQKSFPAARELGLKYKDSIKVIFRDFPGHDDSIDLALAARCAGEQGKFWQMHDRIFQSASGLTSDQIQNLANNIGLRPDEFKKCIDSKKYLAQIQKDYSDAQSLGVTGTPTWYVNGVKIEGEVPLSMWEKLIGGIN
jgi:protein-disulfide isomerase